MMKSNYSDWLLVSDIDGTLNDKKFNLPNSLVVVDEKKYGTIMVTFIKEKDK